MEALEQIALQMPAIDGFLIKIHPDQVFSAVEALEQIALQMPAIDGFLNHFLLFVIPHGIVQHFLQHTQRPQFSGTHRAQVGASGRASIPAANRSSREFGG